MTSSVCRICLVGNIRMVNIHSTHLQEIYERLSNTTLNTEIENGMPNSVCFVCHRQLQKCYKFSNMAHSSNRILQNLLRDGTEVTQKAAALMSLEITQNLTVSPTKCISLGNHYCVKDELMIKEDPENADIEEFKEALGAKIDHSNNIEISLENNTKDVQTMMQLKYERNAENVGLTKHMQFNVPTTEMSDCNTKYSTFSIPGNTNFESVNITVKEEVLVKEESGNIQIDFDDNDRIDGSNNTEMIEQKKEKTNFKQNEAENNGLRVVLLKSYPCSICNKIFPFKANLKKHTLVHTGEKAYSCNECNKPFSRKADLKKHLFVHSGLKPYSCSRCQKLFTRKGGLTKHMLVHTGERAYPCNECNKMFKVKSNLTRHMRVHTGIRPHTCNMCYKSFARKALLIAHMCSAIYTHAT